MRKVADAYYKSNYELRAANITGPPDYDPLAYAIEKAHASGIEVHAWINTFRVWARKELPTDPMHIVLQHPDWITRTSDGTNKAGDGMFLDPGVPEAQDYTFNVFMDIVSNYDIDGIHFDYVRYPGSDFGYAPAAVERFNSETGRSGMPASDDPRWMQWRRDQVTTLVSRIYHAVVALKPRVKVTAATIPWGDCSADFCDTTPFVAVYQDWRSWMQQGILDANIPMNYKDDGVDKSAQSYRNWLSGFKRWKYERHVYCGLDFNSDPMLVLRQLEATRKRGLEGMVGFSFNQSDARVKLVQALRSGIYSDPARVPEMSWKLHAVIRASRDRYAKAVDAATRGRNVDLAITLLKKALEIDPNYVDAHFRLGRCYTKKGMHQEAVKEFQAVLALDSDYLAAQRELRDALGRAAASCAQPQVQ